MLQVNFLHFLSLLPELTDSQIAHVEKRLQGDDPSSHIIKELERRIVTNPECPHCHSTLINHHGKVNYIQRYRCKNCLKTFMSTTGTPLARLRYKDQWGHYLKCMLESKVLRTSAKECGINLKTAFRWRHRFLILPSTLNASTLEGIIEADETLFPYSEKGAKKLTRKPRKRGMKALKLGRSKEDWVPVLTVRDRGKHTYETILPDVTKESLSKALKDRLEKDSVLCTDGLRSYISVSLENDVIHKRLNISAGIKVLDKVFHIQNVNAYHGRLKEWLIRFHGVATKYLSHYLGWHRYMDSHEKLNENEMLSLQQQLKGT